MSKLFVEVEGRNAYQFAHGHFPRGRGSWAFAIGSKKELDDFFWFNGTYGEAVKAAKQKAREVGACYIEVFGFVPSDSVSVADGFLSVIMRGLKDCHELFRRKPIKK